MRRKYNDIETHWLGICCMVDDVVDVALRDWSAVGGVIRAITAPG
jgi:hypothetical protein